MRKGTWNFLIPYLHSEMQVFLKSISPDIYFFRTILDRPLQGLHPNSTLAQILLIINKQHISLFAEGADYCSLRSLQGYCSLRSLKGYSFGEDEGWTWQSKELTLDAALLLTSSFCHWNSGLGSFIC